MKTIVLNSLAVVFSCCMIKIVRGSGFIEIKFLKYENPDLNDAVNNCCETGTSSCRIACNSIFNICLDNSTMPPYSTCSYGNYTSKLIDDDDFEFEDNDKDQNLAKPYQFKFNEWAGDATIEIKVNKKDGSGLIAPFPTFTLQAIPEAYDSTSYKTQKFTHRWRRSYKTLTLQYKIECEAGYIPPLCAISVQPSRIILPSTSIEIPTSFVLRETSSHPSEFFSEIQAALSTTMLQKSTILMIEPTTTSIIPMVEPTTTFKIPMVEPTTTSTIPMTTTGKLTAKGLVKYLLIGCSSGLLTLLTIAAAYFLYKRKMKKRRTNPEESSSTEEAISMNDSQEKIIYN